jgi:hypothetical protein
MDATEWQQSKFDEALVEYSKVSSRTLQEIVNTKAYYIARKALWFSPKADSYAMKQQLGGIVTVRRVNKRGKVVKRRELQLVKSERVDAPLAALIVNKRLGRKGDKGLFGRAMAAAIRELLSSRAKSIAFLKSGWLAPIRKLAPFADRRGAPQVDKEAKQIGRPKGDATPAQPGFNPVAQIVNLASARRDTKGALVKYISPALAQAFQDETASMWAYMEEKMKPDAEAANAKMR